jgi:spore coat polysaccharide biosynthesis protein SpsF
MVRRVRKCRSIDEVVIATTDKPYDDPIADLCREKGIDFFRGSEELVVARVEETIKQYKDVEQVTSLSGDCPFSYPPMIDYVNYLFMKYNYDYISNDVVERSFPDGLDVQVYKPSALLKVIPLINNPKHFSHSAWNIPTYGSELLKIGNWKAPVRYHWPELGLTLDERLDYTFLLSLWDKFTDHNQPEKLFRIIDVINFLREHPEMILNSDVVRKIPGNG